MASERVVIGVVPRDRLSMFPRSLEALYAHTDGLFRVVLVAGVVDNATRQQLESLQTQHDNLSVVLMDRLLEQAAVRNLVLRHVHERVCMLLENDTLVQTNWLPPLLECMREERAAVVAPLLLDFWEGTIHTVGGKFEERQQDGAVVFRHEMVYHKMPPAGVPLQRTRIAYPEAHCLLIDRQQLPEPTLFDDVEPFGRGSRTDAAQSRTHRLPRATVPGHIPHTSIVARGRHRRVQIPLGRGGLGCAQPSLYAQMACQL
jgi:Glycosyl transferase family 2